MSLATVFCRAQNGLIADLVTVEVHLAPGLPGLNVVGLPEAAVREAKDRVRAAIINSGYHFPLQRITCNLAPADLPKNGARFDLAIALGILLGSRQLPESCLDGWEVLGELSLSGEIRAVKGALPAALKAGLLDHRLLLPQPNLAEAALAGRVLLHGAGTLGELCAALHAGPLPLASVSPPARRRNQGETEPDLADVRGQPVARRVLEIAAAGGHSLLMMGPPGAGKSMLAQRLPGILPPPDDKDALEAAMVASISGGFDPSRWGQRPYRAPHHTASAVALVGGGSQPRPGEITLAHTGVLFLDELPEFSRAVLEVLREPLESGKVTISRAAQQVDFPARFQLLAAMNPCPCGYLGDEVGRCRCTPDQIQRYRGRLSGPLLDRIDLRLFVPRVDARRLLKPEAAGESSAVVRDRVLAAAQRQWARQGKVNAALQAGELQVHAALDHSAHALLEQAVLRLGLSARAGHRLLRVARSIADLAGSEAVCAQHLGEALSYRQDMPQVPLNGAQ